MPNHVKNILSISGSKESVARCSEQIFKGGKFSFENIKPMPEELNVESGSKSLTAMEWMRAGKLLKEDIENGVAERYRIGIDEAKAMLQRYADNLAKHGCLTWYEWHCEHWGTKWDAYEIEVVDQEEAFIQINFLTAWSTPLAAINTLAGQYPDLTIDVDFADEDLGNNCGSYGFNETGYWESIGDFDFACEMWGYNPEEERALMEAE